MSESVYIETSVIGYLTARSIKNLIIAGNIETTRDWWQNRRNDFVLYISQVVLDEVAKGDAEIALKRLEILNERIRVSPHPQQRGVGKESAAIEGFDAPKIAN